MSIHLALVAAIRAAHDANPSPASTDVPQWTNEELLRMMFTNLRAGSPGEYRGLQLSQGGLAIMSAFFRRYDAVFPNQKTFGSRHILYLDRICEMPWWATAYLPVTVTLFEPKLAMRAKLVGDLDVLLDAFSS